MFKDINKLRNKCQPLHKSFPNRHFLFRWYLHNFMKRPSIYITVILARFNVKPNTVSIARVILCFGIIPLFYTGHIVFVTLGIILIHLALISDCTDGELARLYETQSLEGAFIDSVTSSPLSFTIYCGSALVAYRLSGEILPLIILILFLGIRGASYRSKNVTILKLILGGDTSLSLEDRGKYANSGFQFKNNNKKNNLFFKLFKKVLSRSYHLYLKMYSKISIFFNGLFLYSIMSITILISMFFSKPSLITFMLLIYLLNEVQSNVIGAISIVKNRTITNTIDNLTLIK